MKLIPRFKQIRESLNMTQAEFSNYLESKNLKISRSAIGRYEAGLVYPSEKTLLSLQKALNVDYYYLSGQGPTEDSLDDDILNLIQESYFLCSDYTDQLHAYLKSWLTMTSEFPENKKYPNDPYSFYQDSEGNIPSYVDKTFPRFSETDSYWKKKLPFLFEDTGFRKTLIGTRDSIFKDRIIQKIATEYTLNSKRRNIDALIGVANNIPGQIIEAINDYRSKKSTLDNVVTITRKASRQLKLLADDLDIDEKK